MSEYELSVNHKDDLFVYGKPDDIEEALKLKKINDKSDISIGFHRASLLNLENAKWLYQNYKEICDSVLEKRIMAKELSVHNTPKKDILCWLKELNSNNVKEEVSLILNKYIYEEELIKSLIEIFPEIYSDLKSRIHTEEPEYLKGATRMPVDEVTKLFERVKNN